MSSFTTFLDFERTSTLSWLLSCRRKNARVILTNVDIHVVSFFLPSDSHPEIVSQQEKGCKVNRGAAKKSSLHLVVLVFPFVFYQENSLLYSFLVRYFAAHFLSFPLKFMPRVQCLRRKSRVKHENRFLSKDQKTSCFPCKTRSVSSSGVCSSNDGVILLLLVLHLFLLVKSGFTV